MWKTKKKIKIKLWDFVDLSSDIQMISCLLTWNKAPETEKRQEDASDGDLMRMNEMLENWS